MNAEYVTVRVGEIGRQASIGSVGKRYHELNSFCCEAFGNSFDAVLYAEYNNGTVASRGFAFKENEHVPGQWGYSIISFR